MSIHNRDRKSLTLEEVLEKSVYYKKWREDNPEKCTEYRKKWESNRPEAKMLLVARQRARKLGIPFNLELSDIHIPDICPVLGIPIIRGKGFMVDSSPSLDRHTPALGYTKGNVQVMSMRANRIKNDGTAEEHDKIANHMRNFSENSNTVPDECISNHHPQTKVC